MKQIRFLAVVLIVLLFPGVGDLPALAGYYSEIGVQKFTWKIEPVTHTYHFAVVAKKDEYTYLWGIDAVYDVEAFTFQLDITRTSTFRGAFPRTRSGRAVVQGVMRDPIIFRNIPIAECTYEINGYHDLRLLPKGSGMSGNACEIANLATYDQHQALKSEYMSLISGNPTLAPFPTSPRENSTGHNPDFVVLDALLPFPVYTPCRWWNFTWLIERHNPDQGGGYKWEPALTQEWGGHRNGDTGQCNVETRVELDPGRHRYKLQARYKDGRKTPWSLPFEFEVAQKKIGLADPDKVMSAINPWIHITKPAAGARWKRGEDAHIRWKSLKVPGDKVWVHIIGPDSFSYRITPDDGVDAGLGHWRWTPGEDIPFGNDYQILVVSREDQMVRDLTPHTVAIIPVLHAGNRGKKLTLENPQGGETWKAGTSYDIRWSRKGVDQGSRIEVALLKDGQFFRRISPEAGLLVHSGKTRWTPGSGIPWSSKYQIRIRLKEVPDVTAESGNFTIMKKLGVEMGGASTGASGAAAQRPALRTRLSGRSFTSPAKVSPSLKFPSGDRLSHFEVQQRTGAGNWSRPVIFKSSTFTITRAGSYRYRAVGKNGVASQWDTFAVRIRPGTTLTF